jgi:hypothetical protein
MVNHFYVYCVDWDFGPFFLKFSTYFPYNAKLCLNGHEYAKRQLAKKGIGFEALDNGVLRCDDPKRLPRIRAPARACACMPPSQASSAPHASSNAVSSQSQHRRLFVK